MKNVLRFLFSIALVVFFIYSNFFAYGSKVTFGPDEEVYYKSGATEEEARKVGKVLQDVGIFTGSNSASLQLRKDDSGYLLRVVVQDGLWDDAEMQESAAVIGYLVSQSLDSKPVKVDLCDDSFDSKKIVDMQAPVEEVSAEGEASPVPIATP